MTAQPYSVEELTKDVEEVVNANPAHAAIVRAVEPLLARFLKAESLPEAYCQPVSEREASAHQDFTLYRLHRGSGDHFNLLVAIWPPGGASGIHDHAGKWVVEGVYRNRLRTVRYRRLDDGTVEERAALEERESVELRPGDISHVLEPDQTIHDFVNRSDEPTVSVHIFGGDVSRERLHYFDLASGAVETVEQELRFDNE